MSALLWHNRGAARLPADIALALIPSLPRPHLERLVQSLIDRMDEADGDTDLEPEETDHTGGEDDCSQTFHDGPGCPISDSDFAVDDQPCDEPFEDLERDDPFKPLYGVDQSDGPTGWRLA
jgi:hypothetical protein